MMVRKCLFILIVSISLGRMGSFCLPGGREGSLLLLGNGRGGCRWLGIMGLCKLGLINIKVMLLKNIISIRKNKLSPAYL